MMTLLQSVANKGRTVKTSFGAITFDAKGFAESDIKPEQMHLPRNLGWLVDGSNTSKEDLLVRLTEQYDRDAESLKKLEAQITDLEEQIKHEKTAKKDATTAGISDMSIAASSDDELMKKLEAEAQAAAAREAAAVRESTPTPSNAAGAKKHSR